MYSSGHNEVKLYTWKFSKLNALDTFWPILTVLSEEINLNNTFLLSDLWTKTKKYECNNWVAINNNKIIFDKNPDPLKKN